MNKEELRKIYLQKRQALTDNECLALNNQLCDSFFSHIDLSSIKVLHTFLPIKKNKEPNTWLIIDRIQKKNPGIKISLPRVNNQTNTLENFYFEGLHQLQENNWGIPEPQQGTLTDTKDIDLVLVPLLTFDKQGHRVGYGKGFYDKFLADCRVDCKKIGLTFFSAFEEINNVTPLDKPLDLIITPQSFIKFN